MRKLIVTNIVSLDGCYEGRGETSWSYRWTTASTSFSKPDERTEEEYRTEVEEHLEACREVLPGRALDKFRKRKMARLPLRLANPTETNLPVSRSC